MPEATPTPAPSTWSDVRALIHQLDRKWRPKSAEAQACINLLNLVSDELRDDHPGNHRDRAEAGATAALTFGNEVGNAEIQRLAGELVSKIKEYPY